MCLSCASCALISSEMFLLFPSGSKTADPCCYGHTQFHLLPDRLKREKLIKQNQAEQVEVVFRANALASLFAWTGAQAMYQGKSSVMALLILESNLLRMELFRLFSLGKTQPRSI